MINNLYCREDMGPVTKIENKRKRKKREESNYWQKQQQKKVQL